MLSLIQSEDRSGLRVRPRYRRLELCGDYVAESRLETAIEFAAGSVAACIGAVVDGQGRGELPPPLAMSLQRALERPGWFIDSNPLDPRGRDLYQAKAESIARCSLSTWLDSLSDAMESPQPFGGAAQTRQRSTVSIAPVVVSWPLTVFLVDASGASAPTFAAVPREWLGRFLDLFDSGALDVVLCSYGRTRGHRERATSWDDVRHPGLFRDIPSRLNLLPPEPMTAFS